MPRFLVRVGYDWVTPCFRDVEIDAVDINEAGEKAVELSEADPAFWTESVDCDGEAGPTEVFEVHRVDPA